MKLPNVLVVMMIAAWVATMTDARALQPESSPEQLLEDAQSSLVQDPARGAELARRAEAIEMGAASPRSGILLRAAWLEAEGLFRMRRVDEAADELETAFETLDLEISEIYGKLLITRGRVARQRRDSGLALESFQEAFAVFSELGNRRYQAIALQSLGTLYTSARQFERAIEYDKRAAAAYPDDPVITLVSLNNRGNALRQLERYDEARDMFEAALEQEIVSQAPNLEIILHSNIAAMEMAAGDLEAARTAVAAAKSVAEKLPREQQPRLPFAVEAKLAVFDGRAEQGASILDRTFEGVDTTATPQDEKNTHALAYEVYEAAGRDAAALDHLKAFRRLEDTERDIAASANLALMNAEFELSNKELEISQLRSERLEADVALIRAKRQQERLLYFGLVLLSFGVIGFLVWQTVQSSRTRRITEALNDQLEDANGKLRETNIELEEANNAKTEFLATTSHEVRTPLNAVINLTAAAIEDTTPGTPAYKRLTTALRSAEHLHEIVTDVLDVARLEGGRMRTNLGAIDIEDVIHDVADLWRPKAVDKGLAFNVRIEASPAPFCTDEKLIRQIISNLLSNAIKFTAEGGVTLSVTGGTQSEPLRIDVRDTGIGIPEESQNVIFESFRQVETGGTRSFSGTGLGLAISRQITELLGGSISLDSKPGAGSHFSVVIPYSDGVEVSAPAPVKPYDPENVDETLQDLSILVAEDNAINAMVVETILKGKVGGLTFVENGAEAVEAVQSGHYDMVLMDKQMPVMDGVEATRRIRALNCPGADVPIVAVTADAFEAAKIEFLEAGADDYLAKPMRPDTLKEAIALNLRHMRPIKEAASRASA